MDKSTQKQMAKEYIREFYRNNRANFTLAVIAATLTSGMQVGIAYLLKELTDVSMSGDLAAAGASGQQKGGRGADREDSG